MIPKIGGRIRICKMHGAVQTDRSALPFFVNKIKISLYVFANA